MKVYLIQAKKRCWANKAAREAMNVQSSQTVLLTKDDSNVTLTLKRAPAAAARVMRAVYAMTGIHGVAIDSYSLSQLGAKPGDTVEAANPYMAERAKSAASASSTKPINEPGAKKPAVSTAPATTVAKPGSLRDRINAMMTGDVIEVSASAAKSDAYSVAKKLGYKVQKAGPTAIKRIS